MRTPIDQRDVLFIDELCERIGVSRATVDRLRQHGAFPIPEVPKIDKRSRWSKKVVAAFVDQGKTGRELLKLAKSA